MKHTKSTIFDALTFYVFYGIVRLLSLLPLRLLYVLSDFLYIIFFYVVGYRKKVVYTNLANAFPEKSLSERKRIARKFYRHLADLIVETVKMISFNEEQLSRRVIYKNPELLHAFYDKGKSVIAVIAHYGNWEWLVASCSQQKHHLVTLYKPLRNKYFNRFFVKLRSKYGMELVPMRKALKTMLEYQGKNIPVVTSFITDQSTIKEKTQYWTTFLNQETGVYLGIEKIARRLGHAVVFLKMHKTGRGKYMLELEKLFDDVANTKKFEVTNRHVAALEEQIRNQPEYWLWTHKRWKIKRDV